MFFKKKKEEPSDQLAVYRERQAFRWGSPQVALNAGITISGFEGEGRLGNVSVTGCSMESVTYAALMPNEVYQVRILPGENESIEPFDLTLKLSWTKSSETLFQAGFCLEDGKEDPKLKRYVEHLRNRGFKPDYGKPGSGRR